MDKVIEEGDPSVPTELLELSVSLYQADMTPAEFKEVFGDGDSDES